MNTASIFKKMAAIVAIVGAGLLAAPLEQAEAQVLSPSHISGITLETSSFGIHCISVDFHVFDTSSDYVVRCWWPSPDRLRTYLHPDFDESAYWTDLECYFFPLPFGNYYTVEFEMEDDSSDWIEVTFWVGLDGYVAYGWATDSDGRSYSVDVTVE